MKNFWIITAVLLLACITMGLFLYAKSIKATGPLQKMSFSFTNFNEVEVSGGFSIFITSDTTESIEVEAPESVLPYIEVIQSFNEIKIKRKTGFSIIGGMPMAKVYIGINQLHKLEASSGAIVKLMNPVHGKKLDIDLNSGSIFTGAFVGHKCEVDVSSGSILNLKGHADESDFEASSGSLIHAIDFTTKGLSVDFSSGCVGEATVSERLKVELSSGAIFSYKGEPVIHSQEVSSGAALRKL